MTKTEDSSWPSETDKDRIWDATQRAISSQSRNAHRHKIFLMTGGAVLILGIAVSAIIFPVTRLQPEATVRCYTEQSTTSEYSTVALTSGQSSLSNSAAITSCATTQYYEKTKSDHIYQASQQGESTHTAPFGACLQPNGGVAVFPLKKPTGTLLTPQALCEQLGLRPLTQ